MIEISFPDWPRQAETGLPDRASLPDAILSTTYVRRIARVGLARPEEKRASYWRSVRSYATRRLHVAGLDEDLIVRTMRAFARRVAAEAEIRRLMMVVESAVEADAAEVNTHDALTMTADEGRAR